MKIGDEVVYSPGGGKPKRNGVIQTIDSSGIVAMVKLQGDPFSVQLPLGRLKPNTTEVKVSTPDAKTLRLEAQALGVKGWEDMSKKKLAKKIEKAKKKLEASESQPQPEAKKAKAKDVTPVTAKLRKDGAPKLRPGPKTSGPAEPGTNPYRDGSAMNEAFSILKEGGTRQIMAEKLSKKVSINPTSQEGTSDISDFDKRITVTASNLEKMHGWIVTRDGRGLNGTITIKHPLA